MPPARSKAVNTQPQNQTLSSINVLHVIGTLQLGGAENQVATLVPFLSNGRYTVHVCCLHREGVHADVLRARGINVISLNMRLRYWPIAVYKLYRLIKQLQIQIVHTHLYGSGIWGRSVGKLADVPVIMSTEQGMTLWKKRHHLIIEGFVNRFTDKIIAVSEDIRQRRITYENVPPEKIVVIPNAVDIRKFHKTNGSEQIRAQLGLSTSSIVVGTVARLVPPKRLDYFLEAARIVCEVMPRVHFLIVGDGPLRSELEDRARQLGLLSNSVQFLGSRQDVAELLAALDIFVLSSEREGLPVSMLEAMAASKPIIVTSVGGIPEVIQNGYNGILVSPHNPSALANAIMDLIENNATREAIAQQGYQTVNTRFSAMAVSRQIASLYDNLLAKKNK